MACRQSITAELTGIKVFMLWVTLGPIFATAGIAAKDAQATNPAQRSGQPEFSFQAVTLASYPPSPGMGSGIAVADFDADGDPDIFLPTGAGVPNQLWRNRGDGSFDEVASSFGLDDLRQARAALWLDYDGDGDLDLFIARDCFASGQNVPATGSCSVAVLSLFEQRASGFVDISAQRGLIAQAGQLADGFHSGGLSAADVSGDGLPDIYAARWQTRPELYLSDTLFITGKGAGYSLGSGLTTIAGQQAGYWQGVMHDFDRDGSMDLFVNVDFSANQLWLNRGLLEFDDISLPAGVASAWNEMGVAAGDYDNDGDVDLFASNIFDWIGPSAGSHNLLLRNDSNSGQVLFTEHAQALGVDDAGWGWGATWLDADNDGDLDLAVTNGYCQPPPDVCPAEFANDRSRLFVQTGPGNALVEAGESVGFADRLTGGGLIAADFNGDGRMDLLQTAIDPDTSANPLLRSERLTLYLNTASGAGDNHGWLAVQPRLRAANSHALGTELRLYLDDGRMLTRWIHAGESWLSQAPARAHFGIGNAGIERLEVDWPELGQNPGGACPTGGQPDSNHCTGSGDAQNASGGTSVFLSPATGTVLHITGPETLLRTGFEDPLSR